MRHILILSLIALLLVSCSKSPEENIADLYANARTAMENLQFDEAERYLEELHQADSTTPLYEFGHGLLLEYKLQPFDALIYYTGLLDTDPSFDSAYIRTLEIYREVDALDDFFLKAGEYSQKKTNPMLSSAYIGESYFNRHNYSVAQTAFKQSILTAKSDSSYYEMLLARTYLRQGDFDSATVYYEQAMSKPNKPVRTFEVAADYLEDHGYYDSALTVHRLALDQQDATFFTKKKYFQRLLDLNRLTDARQFIDSLELAGADTLVQYGFKLAYAFKTKEPYLLRDVSSVHRLLAGNTFTAILYDMRSRGIIHDELSLGQDDMRIGGRLVKESLPAEFEDFMIYYAARVYFDDGHGVNSTVKLEKMEGLRTTFPEVKMRLLTCWFDADKGDEALVEAKMLNEEHLEDPYWQWHLADFYRNLFVPKYELAEFSLLRTLRLSGYFPEAMHDYIDVLIAMKNYNKALNVLSQFPAYSENNPSFILSRAKLHYLNDEYDKGLAAMKEYLPYFSYDLTVIKEIARYLYRHDKTDALADFLGALPLDSTTNADLLLMGTKYALRTGEADKAVSYMARAIAEEPTNPIIGTLYQIARYNNGEKEDVFFKLDSITTLHSTNPHVAYYISKLMAREQTDLNKAANLARTAVFGSGGDVEYMTNLSYVYYQMGRYDLAKGEAIKSRNVDTTYGPAYFRLAMAYNKLHDENAAALAKENLQKALDAGIWGDLKEEASALLKKM